MSALKLYLLGLLFASPAALVQQLDHPIRPVVFTQVKLTDSFWLPRLKTNTSATIPVSFARCESTNWVKNFEMAAAKEGKFATTSLLATFSLAGALGECAPL